MNIDFLDNLVIPIIVAAALCIGYVMKKWLPTDNKWIPTVLLIFGALSGLVLFGANYEGVVKGAISGLAAVGLHQLFKQHFHLDTEEELTDEEAYEWINTDEEAAEEVAELMEGDED